MGKLGNSGTNNQTTNLNLLNLEHWNSGTNHQVELNEVFFQLS